MLSRGKVSIITPFKNTSLYISECIESVLRQDYDDWELWLIDDHSTDNSIAIAQEYARVDTRINVLKNVGKGIIPALQLAYEKCTGAFITRMDSDDIMLPTRLSHMTKDLNQWGRGYVSVGLVKYFNAVGVSDGYRKYEKWLNNLTIQGRNFDEIYKECVIPSPCFMLYKEDFDAIGAFDGDRYPEDYDLTFRMYQKGLQVIPCNVLLHHWRDYDTRTSRTQENYSQIRLLDIRLHYFLELEYSNAKPLLLWGASRKGKRIAQTLVNRNISFEWICDNDKKIGQIIYSQRLQSYKIIDNYQDFQSIIVVANPLAQHEIKQFLAIRELVNKQDYFFFC
jgi:glycosyltransferase involved in cell wall biosynthesis